MRQALFNSLQNVIPGARVLDLFAGSGALGFEALSRGAQSVVFVENSRAALKLIEKNADSLGVRDQITVLSESVHHVWPLLQSRGAPFDVVLADPPYEGGWEDELLEKLPWNELLVEGGCFCLEWGIQKSEAHQGGCLPERVPHLVKVREKNYGDSVLTSYRRES